jgi:hypothetical protein
MPLRASWSEASQETRTCRGGRRCPPARRCTPADLGSRWSDGGNDIIDRAMALLHKRRLDELTTRRLPDRLGVGGRSTGMWGDKRELLISVADPIVAEAPGWLLHTHQPVQAASRWPTKASPDAGHWRPATRGCRDQDSLRTKCRRIHHELASVRYSMRPRASRSRSATIIGCAGGFCSWERSPHC